MIYIDTTFFLILELASICAMFSALIYIKLLSQSFLHVFAGNVIFKYEHFPALEWFMFQCSVVYEYM